MNKIKITFTDKTSIEADNSIKPVTILSRIAPQVSDAEQKILAVKVNNELYSLESEINISADIEPVFENSKEGAAIYRRSLCFVLAAAAYNLFPGTRLLVGHRLGYGYYYTIDTQQQISPSEIKAIQAEMKRIISADEIIETRTISYKEACELFESLNLIETRKQLNYRTPPRIKINTLEKFSDMYFEPLVGNTGMLDVFDLVPYNEGFLLRFPSQNNPSSLPEFHDQPNLFQFRLQMRLLRQQLPA